MRTPIAIPTGAKKGYKYISAIDIDGAIYRLCDAVTEKSALEIACANIRLHPDVIYGDMIVFCEGVWRKCCEWSI